MRPVEFYFYLGVILALPPIVVLVMLVRSAGAVVSGDTRLAEQQRVGLRLLLTQALVPPLQVLPLLRSATSAPSRAATVGTLLLPVASLLLGGCSMYFIVRYSRGVARFLLPTLNLLVFTFTAALFIAAGATA